MMTSDSPNVDVASLATDMAIIVDLLALTPWCVGTRTTPAKTKGVPGPRPPVSLESWTIADVTPINPRKALPQIEDLDPHGDAPAKILTTWWTWIVDHITPTYPDDLIDADDRTLSLPISVARLIAVNVDAWLATGDDQVPVFAWMAAILTHRLRQACGEPEPRPTQCPSCHQPLTCDSTASRVLTCATCGWQRTAPILLTLPQIADMYDSTDDGHTWRPTLRTLRYWRDRAVIEPHTGLLSDTGEHLYRLETVERLTAAKRANGWTTGAS